MARIREVMKTRSISTEDAPVIDAQPASAIRRMFKPEVAAQATMLAGGIEQATHELAAILESRGLLR